MGTTSKVYTVRILLDAAFPITFGSFQCHWQYLFSRIGKSSGYKTSELQTLGEGHTLAIGGKEIEVIQFYTTTV